MSTLAERMDQFLREENADVPLHMFKGTIRGWRDEVDSMSATPLDLRVPDGSEPALTFGNDTWDTDPTDLNGSIFAEDDGSLTLTARGRLLLQILSGAIVVQGVNAAPADGQIGFSDFAIWFDDTPGAAKIKIKAKNANGVFVTGTINLS